MKEYHSHKFQVQSSTLPEFRKGAQCAPLPPLQGNAKPKKPGAARVNIILIKLSYIDNIIEKVVCSVYYIYTYDFITHLHNTFIDTI